MVSAYIDKILLVMSLLTSVHSKEITDVYLASHLIFCLAFPQKVLFELFTTLLCETLL